MQVTFTKKDITRITELKKIFDRVKLEVEGVNEALAFGQVAIWAHELETRMTTAMNDSETEEKARVAKGLELLEESTKRAESNVEVLKPVTLTKDTPKKGRASK
jgi:hypothetical protein